MSKKVNRKSVIGRACNAMMETLERRVLFAVTLPNPPVPTPNPPLGTTPLQGLVGTPQSLSPSMMRVLYSLNNVYLQSPFDGSTVPADGAGQTIAIVDAYGSGTIVNDVQVFDKQWDLSNADANGNFFLTIQALGATENTPVGVPASIVQGWAEETSLDVEWAHVMAPEAHILLVEAASQNFDDLIDADVYANAAVGNASFLAPGENPDEVVPGISDAGPSVVSNSWGFPTTLPGFAGFPQIFDGYFSTPTGHQGVTDFFSSGDSGTLEYPAASDNVVAVGGSTDVVDINGNLTTFTTWAGSGGGPDPLYAGSPNTPMLAMDADPRTGVWIYDSQLPPPPRVPPGIIGIPPGWEVIGGTSLSCPMFAAAFSIIQQGLTLEGAGTLDTSQTITDLEVAGEANSYYYKLDVARPGNFNEFTTYPLWGKGANVTIPDSTKIPGNGNTGFGEPIFDGSDVEDSGVAPYIVGGSNNGYQITDGLFDLFLSQPFADSIGYLENNPALDLQAVLVGKSTTNSYYPAPSSHMVIDTIDEENLTLQGEPESDSMKFLTTPGVSVQNTAAGQPVGGANGFVIDVADEFGNLDTTFEGAVTLTLTSAAEAVATTNVATGLPFAAGSITSVQAINGVATFNDVVINQAGDGYVLIATSAGGSAGGFAVTPAVSTSFDVSAGVATQIVITTEPISTFQFADVPVIVSLEDQYGNIDTSDNYSGVNLTVDTGPAGFSVPVSTLAVDGIASFDLTFGVPGIYTLLATDPFEGFQPAMSPLPGFVISPVVTEQRGLNGTIISAPGINQQQERNGPVQAGS